MAKQPNATGRRSFFKKAAACAGALFLAPKAVRAAPEPEPDKGQARKRDTGYRDTEHIRKYYETAMR
jgi:hypothetical protein